MTWLDIGYAFWLGLLTAISPCPLATNVAAISFIGRQVGNRRGVLASGLLYTLGRTLCSSSTVGNIRRDGRASANLYPAGHSRHDAPCAVRQMRAWMQFLRWERAASAVRAASVCSRPQHRCRFRTV